MNLITDCNKFLSINSANFILNINYSAVDRVSGKGTIENTHSFGSIANFVEHHGGKTAITSILRYFKTFQKLLICLN